MARADRRRRPVRLGGIGLRYLLHRKQHHRLERWLPLVLTVYGTAGAIHNARYWDDASARSAAQRR